MITVKCGFSNCQWEASIRVRKHRTETGTDREYAIEEVIHHASVIAGYDRARDLLLHHYTKAHDIPTAIIQEKD